MSPLPQRKKTPEELAKLRAELGVPGARPEDAPGAAPVAVGPPPAPARPPAPPPAVDPDPEFGALEGIEATAGPAAAPARPAARPAPAVPPAPAASAPRKLKPSRSLRKADPPLRPAEGVPRAEAAFAAVPAQRHSDAQLEEMRRRGALSVRPPVTHLQMLAAHPVQVVPGYLFNLAAAGLYWGTDLPVAIPAACLAPALLLAGWLAWKKPRSRHHAGFIAVFAVLIAVFGAIHHLTPPPIYGP